MSTISPTVFPPLREGDRLSSDEFISRWEAMPDVKHAELIDGVVYMASPVLSIHGIYHFRVCSWLTFYLLATPGCEALADTTWKMSEGNVPQPDLALRILPDHGVQSGLEAGYSTGAPELIIEVSVSTSARDAGSKLRLYERSGVREYLTIRPEKKQLIWRELAADGRYREVEADESGLFQSRVFPGLWLNPMALWSNDLSGLAAAVERGVASKEHAQFVLELGRRMGN